MSLNITLASRVSDGGGAATYPPATILCGFHLLVVIGALRACGLVRTHRLLTWLTRGRRPSGVSSLAEAESVARRVALAAALYPGRARCLEQSLTLYWLLRRMNMDAVLRLGVQPLGFTAHAWIEYGGRPVLEGEIVRTVLPFPELPS